MSRVLFTHSFFYKLDPKQWSFHQPYPPLGTLLAAAVLREKNYEVSLWDAGLASSPDNFKDSIHAVNPRFVVIYDDGFNYLTKMCLTVMREAAFTMVRLAKQHGCTVIICSSDATDHYKKYLEQGVDFVIQGEGEETLSVLLEALETDKPVDTITGIAFQRANLAMTNPPRPVLRNLDELPMPAWDLVDIEAYRSVWLSHHGYFSLNIATTRGCPFKCNWCAKPIYGNRYNSRSPEKVVEEIEFLLRQFNPDHFWMCDDIFGLTPGWVKQFRDLIIQKSLRFRYKIQSRVDLLLKEETIKSLSESGCETVWVGAESGSQKILDAMDKGTTVDEIYLATKQLRKQGVRVAFFLQFGYPGEMRDDVDATLKMVLELMPDDIGISISYPLPGTKFYETVKGQLGAKQNWSDSDDLALLFRNTYSPLFYKNLYHYVHNRYRMKRGTLHLVKWARKPFSSLPDLKKIVSIVYYLLPSLFYTYRIRRHSLHAF